MHERDRDDRPSPAGRTAYDHTITAADGRQLAATTFPGTTDDVVVIAGATGVPRRFYRALAQAAAAAGPTAITFDYRGMADSRIGPTRREDVRMRDWGQLDIEGVIQHAQPAGPGRLLWIGQSAGGVFLPLAPSRGVPARVVTVAALSGHWALMAPSERLKLWFGWYLFFPAVTGLLGYAPRQLWGGDGLPAGVMRDWGTWCRHPDYFFGDPTLDASGFDELTAPVLAVRATDDPWATYSSHRVMHARFTAADVTYRDVTPEELGATRIGHIDLLRGSVGAPVWPELFAWLLA